MAAQAGGSGEFLSTGALERVLLVFRSSGAGDLIARHRGWQVGRAYQGQVNTVLWRSYGDVADAFCALELCDFVAVKAFLG